MQDMTIDKYKSYKFREQNIYIGLVNCIMKDTDIHSWKHKRNHLTIIELHPSEPKFGEKG